MGRRGAGQSSALIIRETGLGLVCSRLASEAGNRQKNAAHAVKFRRFGMREVPRKAGWGKGLCRLGPIS